MLNMRIAVRRAYTPGNAELERSVFNIRPVHAFRIRTRVRYLLACLCVEVSQIRQWTLTTKSAFLSDIITPTGQSSISLGIGAAR